MEIPAFQWITDSRKTSEFDLYIWTKSSFALFCSVEKNIVETDLTHAFTKNEFIGKLLSEASSPEIF